jgi:hypothetical protein
MVEAAQAAGLPSVTIRLGPATAAAVPAARLQALAGGLGRVVAAPADGGALAVTVTFAAGGAAAADAGMRAAVERAERARAERDRRLAARDRAAVEGAAPELPAQYRAAVERLAAAAPTHEGTLDEAPGTVLANATHDAVTLAARIDPATHVVREARHGGGRGEGRTLLDGLCAGIEGKPILEAAYHGVVRLESALRDPGAARPVAGVVTPESGAPAFRPLVALLRALLADYRRRTGFAERDSRWEPEPTPAWRALTHGERLERLQRTLDEAAVELGLAAGELRCLRLEKNVRVTVELPVTLPPAHKAKLLMALEGVLKRRLEPTLHLYQEELRDRHKLRRL